MAMLTSYPAVTRFDTDDILIKDGTNGTKKMKAKDAAVEFAGLVSVENHRNTYRGKALGSTVTTTQKDAIQKGTFDDLYVGDYWTIGGVNYRIADMDYWYNCGDTAFTKHHLLLVPDTALYSNKMNDENTTKGGYVGSKMYTEYLESAKTTIKGAFSGLVQSHQEYLTNAVTDGHASAGGWFESEVELMNEVMVYGSYIYTPGGNGTVTPNRYTINNQQLALFALNPKMIKRRYTYWLRDVVSAPAFAIVDSGGAATYFSASGSFGVRPVFAIG